MDRDYSEFKHDAMVPKLKYEAGPQGDVNAAAMFTDMTGPMTIPKASHLDVKYSVTVLMHVQPHDVGNLLSFGGPEGHGLSISEDDKLTFSPVGQTPGAPLEGPKTDIDISNKWQYVAMTYDYTGGAGKVYIDGNEKNSVQIGKNIMKTDEDIEVGGGNFTGLISCLRIYDRALTRQEINDAKACPLGE